MELDEFVNELRGAARQQHDTLGAELLHVSETIYYPDMYIIAGLNRSLSLMRGFADLVASRNYISAAPLVRLQLDNALRAAAMAMVPNPHEFAQQVLCGKKVRQMRDRAGEKLSDAYLCKCLSQQWPWIAKVYEHASGYVHLSDQHILTTFKRPDGKPVDHFRISEDNGGIPENAYHRAAQAFGRATAVFLDYVAAWIREKRRIVADLSGA
jgi:hypothetical protein